MKTFSTIAAAITKFVINGNKFVINGHKFALNIRVLVVAGTGVGEDAINGVRTVLSG